MINGINIWSFPSWDLLRFVANIARWGARSHDQLLDESCGCTQQIKRKRKKKRKENYVIIRRRDGTYLKSINAQTRKTLTHFISILIVSVCPRKWQVSQRSSARLILRRDWQCLSSFSNLFHDSTGAMP